MTSFANNWTRSYRINKHCVQLERLTDLQLQDIGVPRANIRKVVSRIVASE